MPMIETLVVIEIQDIDINVKETIVESTKNVET